MMHELRTHTHTSTFAVEICLATYTTYVVNIALQTN